ncbi:MAG: hypothetical protein FD160_3763 [Caulobacteraceae bacterium]|nr:MAG: hypothetical protein FD160_3763 [Caulobacteraceae bacterium]
MTGTRKPTRAERRIELRREAAALTERISRAGAEQALACSRMREVNTELDALELDEDPLLTIPEAAARMQCSEDHVRNLKNNGVLASSKPGKHILIRTSVIDAYLEPKGGAR